MRGLSSYNELENLGELLIKDYIKQTGRKNVTCVDIEGFITDYLGLSIEYATFAESDPGRIGYLSNGVRPLHIRRGNQTIAVTYPINTVVLEKALLRPDESGRLRFSMAHEGAHSILIKHIPAQAKAAFHSDFDRECRYSSDELSELFSLNEVFANRLAAVLLMPRCLVLNMLKKYNKGKAIIIYDRCILAQEEKLKVQKMADCMGASYTAFMNRLSDLDLLEMHDPSEYVGGFRVGGVRNG